MVYVFLTEGFEEIEAVAPVDILRRAGLSVMTVGVGGMSVTGSHGITVSCDIGENDISLDENLQAVILPGGMPGTSNLERSANLQSAIDYAHSHGKLICAICAAPLILGRRGLLSGKRACCYPGYEQELSGAEIVTAPVCVDGQFITSRGAGTAIAFALKIAEALTDQDKARSIEETMQCPK